METMTTLLLFAYHFLIVIFGAFLAYFFGNLNSLTMPSTHIKKLFPDRSPPFYERSDMCFLVLLPSIFVVLVNRPLPNDERQLVLSGLGWVSTIVVFLPKARE
jgi:hypothetical protein